MELVGQQQLPVGRHLAVDERGVLLRATWRLDHGFINLSLWREDLCVETFHLTPAAAAELVSFLASGLADATAVASAARLIAIEAEAEREVPPSPATRVTEQVRTTSRSVRSWVAGVLGSAAEKVEP
jgi:hypothetical protein